MEFLLLSVFRATVKPICLPRSWDEPGFNKPTHCYVVGLGHQLMGQQGVQAALGTEFALLK